MTKMMHILMMTLLTLLTLIMTSTPAIVPDGQGIHHQIQHPPVSVKTQHSLAQMSSVCKNFNEPCRHTNECNRDFECRETTGDELHPEEPQIPEPFPWRCRMPSPKATYPSCMEMFRACRESSQCCACLSCRPSPEEDMWKTRDLGLRYISPRCIPID